MMNAKPLRLFLILAIGVVTSAAAQETTKGVPGSAALLPRWDIDKLAKAP